MLGADILIFWFSEQLDRKTTEQEETAAKIQELEQQIQTVSAKNPFTSNTLSASGCIFWIMASDPQIFVLTFGV